MDIWILIAAVGSGYLAQSWQRSQDSKVLSGDVTDDDDDRSGTTSTRWCHYISSSKKKRFLQNRSAPKLSQGGGAVRGGYLPLLDDSESWEMQAVREDACSYPSTPEQPERCYGPAHCHSTYGANVPSRCSAVSKFNTVWPQKCCDFVLVRKLPNKASSKLVGAFPDTWHCYMSNLYSKDHLDTCEIDTIHDCTSSSRYRKNGHDRAMANKMRPFSPNRTWRTGYQDQCEHVCAVGLSDAHIMQECDVRGSTNIRPQEEDERGSSFIKRKRSLACSRPLTSFKSYDKGDECRQEITCGHRHISSAHTQSLCQHGELFGVEAVKAIASDYFLGDKKSQFTSAGRMSSTVLNKIKLPSLARKHEVDSSLERSSIFRCIPSPSFNGGMNDARRKTQCGDSFELKGVGSNLLQILLFNFGVGVGMMFAIMSNKHDIQQSVDQLEGALCALKGLEGEVQGRKKLRLRFDNTKGIRENVFLEKSHSVLKLVQKVVESVEQLRISLNNSASASARDCFPQERARLEAELEAELERMEMDLNLRDATEYCGRYSPMHEDELEVDIIVQGELSTRGIPCDVDAQLSTLDGNNSSHEFLHFGNCAVPPVELAKRLYEVLEARQEEKIREFEGEIKRLNSMLKAKEQEFQALKQRVYHLLQETACMSLSDLQKDIHVAVENTSMKALFSSSHKQDCSLDGLEHSVLLVCNNEESWNDCVDNIHSINPSIPEPRTLCDNLGSGSPNHSHNGLLKDADKRELWSRGMTMNHPEVVHVSYSSMSSGLPNGPTIETLGSTCLGTSMDRDTRAQGHLNNQLNSDIEIEMRNRREYSVVEWNEENMRCLDTVCPSQDICAQDVIDICESHGQCGQLSDWSMSEETSNSDLDEQLGQLLIERIVQKGRKGSLIVEIAKSVMASFDFDDTGLEMEIPSG